MMGYIGAVPNGSPLFLYCTKQGFIVQNKHINWRFARNRGFAGSVKKRRNYLHLDLFGHRKIG